MIKTRPKTLVICPVCRKPLPGNAPAGLCPACLTANAASAVNSPEAQPPEAGFDYELLGEIAHGGMGVVHYARQISLNRPVALKMIRSGQLATAAEIARFRTEAEAAANLNHSNIVPIFEIGEHEGQRYFSMKLIEGGNLGERLASHPYNIPDAVRLVIKIAHAVHHAHQRGVLHRDLKPSNILLDESGEPYLTDFGLAKILESRQQITQTLAVLGTPQYMAPEQASGTSQQITTAADVYSLGTILYELLLGRPPFQGDNATEVLMRVQQCEPESLRKLNPAIDRDLDTICLKCLEKEPTRRYPSAEALARDLERWLEHKPIEARASSSSERAIKWIRRNPAVASLTAAATIILLCGIVGVFVQWRRAETNFGRAEINAGRAQASASESRDRLVRLNVANGVRLLDDGDSFGALVWFAEALKLDQGNPKKEADHRLRIATTLQHSPRLLQQWIPGGPVHSAEFSRDGRWVLATSGTNHIAVWNTDSGNAASKIIHPVAGLFTAHLSRDASRALSVGENQVCLWDPSNGVQLRSWQHPGVHWGAFAPDGQLIATASREGTVYVWKGASGERLFQAPGFGESVLSLEFSQDGKRLLAASSRLVRVVDVLSRRVLAEWAVKGSLRQATFDAPGERIVTAHWDKFARIWNAATGEPLTAPLKEGTWLNQAAFSPDGKYIATAAGGHVGRVYTSKGTTVGQLSGHKNVVTSVDFSSDGQSIVTCSFDGTARVHSTEGKHLGPLIRHGGLVTAGHFHPDGKRLLTASADGTVRIWEIGDPPVLDVPFTNPDTRFVNAMRDGTAVILQNSSNLVEVFDTRTWQVISRVQLSDWALHAWVSQRDRRLMTVLLVGAGSNYVYRVETRDSSSGSMLATVDVPAGMAEMIQGSPGCFWFALAGNRGVRVFSFDGKTTFSFDTATRPDLAFSRDNRLMALTVKNDVEIIDLKTGRLAYPALHHAYRVVDAEFSPDTRYLATACQDAALAPRSAFIWNVQKGSLASKEMGHADGVFRAAFSSEGSRLVTASEDGTGRIWSVPSGAPLTPPLRHSVAVYDTTFSPDGKLVATASQDMTARVWDTETGEPLTPRLRHDWRVEQVLFLGDSRYLLTRSVIFPVKTNMVTQRMRLWALPRDDRPIDDLVLLTRLLSGQGFDSTGALSPLDLPALETAWQTLSAKYPSNFSFNASSGSKRRAEIPRF